MISRVRELNSAIDAPVERNGKRVEGRGKKKEKGKKCNFGFNGSEKCCGSRVMVYISRWCFSLLLL